MRLYKAVLFFLFLSAPCHAVSDFVELDNTTFYAETDTLSRDVHVRYYRDEGERIILFSRVAAVMTVGLVNVPTLDIYFTVIDTGKNTRHRARAQNWIDSGALKIIGIKSGDE